MPANHPNRRARFAKWSASLAAFATLAGCQTGPSASPDVVRAACLSQRYLLVNGFLNTPPKSRTDLTITTSDAAAYEVNKEIDYDRMIADRYKQFSGKLRGVKMTDGFEKYVVVYRPVKKATRCIAVTANFAFALFADSRCSTSGPLMRLRENSLSCDQPGAR